MYKILVTLITPHGVTTTLLEYNHQNPAEEAMRNLQLASEEFAKKHNGPGLIAIKLY